MQLHARQMPERNGDEFSSPIYLGGEERAQDHVAHFRFDSPDERKDGMEEK
jgi:hypothetical protein